jgi:hypothetical protein
MVNIIKKVEGGGNPSWSLGKVLYEIFGISTNDYHNELYAIIQAVHGSISDCDNFLITQPSSITKISSFGRTTYQCLSTMIRNHIDHPDNPSTKLTLMELKKSIQFLKSIV